LSENGDFCSSGEFSRHYIFRQEAENIFRQVKIYEGAKYIAFLFFPPATAQLVSYKKDVILLIIVGDVLSITCYVMIFKKFFCVL